MTVIAGGRDAAVRSILRRSREFAAEFWRYFLVTALALGVDFGVLVFLKEAFHVYYLIASATSYMVGAVAQYALSIVFVFRRRRLDNRSLEFVAFMLLGLGGLAVTQLVIWLWVAGLGMSYMGGKVAATGVSFAVNYVTRRVLLFSGGRTRA